MQVKYARTGAVTVYRYLLQTVIEQVEYLQVLQVGDGGGQLGDLVMTEGEASDVLHPPKSAHVRVQGHQGPAAGEGRGAGAGTGEVAEAGAGAEAEE